MKKFLTNFSNKFKKTHVTQSTKVDTSILNQRPDVLLSELKNLEYSVSEIRNPENFMYNGKTFEENNLHNRLITYGEFFESFYWDYFEHLTCKIQDDRLPSSGYFHNYPWETQTDALLFKRDERPYISDGAYTKMPKRYRGVFKKYNSIAYVLNINAKPHKIFIVKPENRPEMESLLFRMAQILDETTPGHSIRYLRVEDSSSHANDVTKEQIDAIKELRDICVKLNNITEPGFKHTCVHTGERTPRHGARDIYNEYQNELTQQNRFWRFQQEINNAKIARELELCAAKRITKKANSKYDEIYKNIIIEAKQRVK